MEKITSLKYNMEDQSTTMIMNGVSLKRTLLVENVSCGNCGYKLISFEPNTPIQERRKYLKETVSTNIVYCPKCGFRLDYSSSEILEVEAKEVKC